MKYINFIGVIASVSALVNRTESNDINRLNVSILTVISFVDGKPLRSPLWVNIIVEPETAVRLGLVIKSKSMHTPMQDISTEELASYGLTHDNPGTTGFSISFDAVGLDPSKARTLNTPGLPKRTVYPARGVTNITLDEDKDSLMTTFDTVDDVNQTLGYRPPSAVVQFVQSLFQQKERTEVEDKAEVAVELRPQSGALAYSLEDFEF